MSATIFSLLDTPAYGGAEEYLLTVLLSQKEKGNRVVLATNNAFVKQSCIGKLEVIDLPYRLDAIGNWKGLVKYFFALPHSVFWVIQTIRRLQKETSSSVLCLFPGYSDRLSFSPVVKWLGCKLLWLEYGPLEPTFTRNHGFPRVLYAIGRPFPDMIVTISEWTKKSLLQVGRMQERKIHIIYPGVELFANKKVQSEENAPCIVTTVARLAKEKEIDLLLRAWSKADLTDAMLIIVGDGPEKQSLQKLSTRLKIENTVQFTGFVPAKEKMRILANSDFFVFPSAWDLEGFGMTTIEAMSVGLPIITTGYGPQSEIVRNGTNGWYFQPHDANDLADTIRTACTSKKKETYARESTRIVKEKFLRSTMLTQWKNIISLVESRGE